MELSTLRSWWEKTSTVSKFKKSTQTKGRCELANKYINATRMERTRQSKLKNDTRSCWVSKEIKREVQRSEARDCDVDGRGRTLAQYADKGNFERVWQPHTGKRKEGCRQKDKGAKPEKTVLSEINSGEGCGIGGMQTPERADDRREFKRRKKTRAVGKRKYRPI